MNTSKALRRRQRTTAVERAQILATFERSGMSAAAFARQHGLHYSTFCAWRRQQAPISPAFVQIELAPPSAPVELVVELGARIVNVCELWRISAAVHIHVANRERPPVFSQPQAM